MDKIRLYLERRIKMTEFRETTGEKTQNRALFEALTHIKNRGQQYFSNPLEVKYCDPYYGPGSLHPFYYLAEIKMERWLGLIPRKKQCMIFGIFPGFCGEAFGRKEINCDVFNRSVLDIIKDEIKKYADTFQATAVNITCDFDEDQGSILLG